MPDVNIHSNEGRTKIIKENLHEKVCEKAGKDAVGILKDMMDEYVL